MTTVTALLTNKAYGYPNRGAPRRRKRTVIAVLHQTANPKAGPMDEWNYANRAGSTGPSATAYVGRDGTVVRAVDPAKYAAWSQSDVAHPDALAQAHMVAGVNFNEVVFESIGVCGSGTQPFSAAQFEAVAQLVAAAHRATGLPVDRAHVLAHADVNSVSRASDPWPALGTRVGPSARAVRRWRPTVAHGDPCADPAAREDEPDDHSRHRPAGQAPARRTCGPVSQRRGRGRPLA